MEERMDISIIGDDNTIDIKDLPHANTVQKELPHGHTVVQIEPHYLKSLDGEKVIGGIFNDKSIKLNRAGKKNLSFTPDSTNAAYKTNYPKGSKNGSGGDDGMGDLERRVENLEISTRKIQEQLEGIKEDTLTTKSKLEGIVTKADLLQLQVTLTQTIQEAIKPLPNEDKVKVIINESIKANELPKNADVKVMINDSNKSLIKWIIGTGIATIGATAGIVRLFL